jgi:hypothetical protein
MNSNGFVQITFQLPSREGHTIDINTANNFQINQIHPSAVNTNTSYEYSGRHDQGILPELKSDGYLSQLLSAMQEAKDESDRYLTALIGEELKQEEKNSQEADLEAYAEMMLEDEKEETEESRKMKNPPTKETNKKNKKRRI